jgi:hypothetical protein
MELSEWFLAGLRDYDQSLSAVFDDQEDTIHLFYSKSGRKSLAYSVRRENAELYPELQRRILRELPLKDVWRRHGSGKAYDDYLEEEDRKRRESAQRKMDDDRLQRMKDSKWSFQAAIENARAGRFTAKEARPFEIPVISVPADIPKEGKEQS